MELMIIRKQTQSRRLPCRLTEAERIDRARELAGAVEETEEARQRVAKLAEELKKGKDEDLKPKEGRVGALSKVISSGTEVRDVECKTGLDYEQKIVVTQRVDTSAVVAVRNMTDAELQAELYEEGEIADMATVRQLIREYFQRGGEGPVRVLRSPGDMPDTDEAPADADEPAEEPPAKLGRIAELRAGILAGEEELDTPELLQEVLCALGYWADAIDALDGDGRDWIYRERAAAQVASGQREGAVRRTERPLEIAEPPPGVAETDEQLAVALVRPGYWFDPASLGMIAWEEVRHFASTAPSFDINESEPSDRPVVLEGHGLDQPENLGALLLTLGYQILGDDGEELPDWDGDGDAFGDAFNATVAWAAESVGDQDAFTRPAFLEPFAVAAGRGGGLVEKP